MGWLDGQAVSEGHVDDHSVDVVDHSGYADHDAAYVMAVNQMAGRIGLCVVRVTEDGCLCSVVVASLE